MLFLAYVGDVKIELFSASDEERSQILTAYLERQPPPLNTQFGERLPKPEAIERQQQRKRNITQLYPLEEEQESLQRSSAEAAVVPDAQPSKQRRPRRCQKCKQLMLGHKKGQCPNLELDS
eukprot:Seg5555.2 transcript_id=Seg5555.2/GoldUCD/mRNA.D3Y31 product="hypothetical protein" protein_id=Seg5555.2/GoldUCD/D3Y31